jgi:hypothetical protein
MFVSPYTLHIHSVRQSVRPTLSVPKTNNETHVQNRVSFGKESLGNLLNCCYNHGAMDKSVCCPIMFCNSYHTQGNPLIGGNPN